MSQTEYEYIGYVIKTPDLISEYDIKPDDFSVRDCQILYKELINIYKLGLDIDSGTFFDFFMKQQPYENSALQLLIEINGSFIGSTPAPYANAIIRESRSRKLANTLQQLSVLVSEHGKFEDKLDTVLEAISKHTVQDEKEGLKRNDSLKKLMEEMERRKTLQGIDGLSTGFHNLDDRFNGLKNGDLIIVAGRPSMGKTTFALNIADHNAADGKGVLVVSLEMGDIQLTDKTISSTSGIDLEKIKKNNLTEKEQELFNNTVVKLTGQNVQVVENTYTVKAISRAAKKMKYKDGLHLIVIDYIQQMNDEGKNRTEQITNITRGLKRLARELNVPVIALSQLNRGVESRPNKRPSAADLKESGSIEEDADIIMFVYRDEFYYPNHVGNAGFAEILTSKFRNGAVGTNLLGTQLEKSRFHNLTVGGYKPKSNKDND